MTFKEINGKINSNCTFSIPVFFFLFPEMQDNCQAQGYVITKKKTKAELTLAILKCKCYCLNFQVRVFEFSALHNILS